MADTRNRRHGRAGRPGPDLYRKVRRAKRHIRRFKMKRKAANTFIRHVLRNIVEG